MREKPSKEAYAGIGKQDARETARTLVWPICALSVIVVGYVAFSSISATSNMPLVTIIDKEGSVTFADTEEAQKALPPYESTVEEFAHLLFDLSPGGQLPDKNFSLLCTPEVAQKAALNWKSQRADCKQEYQQLVPMEGVKLLTFLGERDGKGVCRVRGLLTRYDVTRRSPIEIDEVNCTVTIAYSPRPHLRHIKPYIVVGLDFRQDPKN